MILSKTKKTQVDSKQSFEQALAQAKQWQQAGNLNSALDKYRELLTLYPQHQPRLYQLIAMACYQNQQYPQAIEAYQKAIKLAPEASILLLHLGNVHKTIKQYDQAKACYHQSIAITDANDNADQETKALAWHNLGVVAYQEGNINQAIEYYQLALKNRADYIDAHYHLALCYLKTGQHEQTLVLLKDLLKLCPKHFSGLFILGTEYMRQGNYLAAIEYFKQAQLVKIDHLELQINLGHCFLHTQQYLYARDCYRYALELSPDDPELYFNLGILAEKESFIDHAINHYLNALKIKPQYFAAHYNIALLFLQKQHPAKAKQHLVQALKYITHADHQQQHYQENINFMLSAIEQDPRLSAAPKQHIASLFNQYADYYDKHMLEALDYQLPQKLFAIYSELLNKNYLIKPKKTTLLGLGCGTGLAAEQFKPYVDTMIGVDLAENMLTIAREKQLYAELIQADILRYLTNSLNNHHKLFDLIICADVLVYFGDLTTFFSALKTALAPNGVCLLTIEEGATAPYRIDQSGRFLHHPSYINQLIDQFAFKLIKAETHVARQQNNQPVTSLIYCIALPT